MDSIKQEIDEDRQQIQESDQIVEYVIYEINEIDIEDFCQVKIEEPEVQEIVNGGYAAVAATPDIENYTEMDIKDKQPFETLERSELRAHVDLPPKTCAICAKKFTRTASLTAHMRLHTGEKPYQCDRCGIQFIHYSSFHMHKMAHDDVRDKACTVCGILFRSNSHLSRHMLVHTGAKPHACPKCGIRFAQRYNMNAHLKSHSGIHRTKKHVCPNCQKTFARVGQLQEHLKQCQPTATPENTPLLLEDG